MVHCLTPENASPQSKKYHEEFLLKLAVNAGDNKDSLFQFTSLLFILTTPNIKQITLKLRMC